MAYYKLIDAITVPMTINIATRQNGYTKYGHIRLEPHKEYEIPNDDLLLKSLKTATSRQKYSEELEKLLEETGATYKVELCKSCGGKVKKIVYNVVEVIDDGKSA